MPLSSSGTSLTGAELACLPPPPWLSGPLSISELSGCQHLLPYLVLVLACFLTASRVTPPALTAPTATPPSWNTDAKLSSEHLALTHRQSSPSCSPTGFPPSSYQCAGSRAFRVLIPLLPEHPAQAGSLGGHSQQLCSRLCGTVEGKRFPDPNFPQEP